MSSSHVCSHYLNVRLNNYYATLTWIPGKEMVFADHLSRNVATEKSQEPTCKGLDLKVEDIYLNASDEKYLSLAKETGKDEILVALKSQIIKGWLDKRDECPTNLREYWMYRDELSILDSLVLKGSRIVIPNQCRDELLELLQRHTSEQTGTSCKLGTVCTGLASTRT